MFAKRQVAPPAHFMWRFVFPCVVMLAAVAVGYLTWEVVKVVLSSSPGRLRETFVADPSEAGYLEFVDPTDTLLLLHTHEDSIVGITLLVQPNSGGVNSSGLNSQGANSVASDDGALIIIPAELIATTAGGTTADGGDHTGSAYGGGAQIGDVSNIDSAVEDHCTAEGYGMNKSFADIYELCGDTLVREGMEQLFRIGFDDVIEITGKEMQSLIEQSLTPSYSTTPSLTPSTTPSPQSLQMTLTDDVLASEWQSLIGMIANQYAIDADATDSLVTPSDVTSTVDGQDSDVQTLLRFLQPFDEQAPVDVLLADMLIAVPNIADDADTADGVPVTDSAGVRTRYKLTSEGREYLIDWVGDKVPWPAAPGSFARPKVAVLDGIGNQVVRDNKVGEVSAAGGIITIVGNAKTFDWSETVVEYHRPEVREVADKIAINLQSGGRAAGVTFAETTESQDYFTDITVTIGLDAASELDAELGLGAAS